MLPCRGLPCLLTCHQACPCLLWSYQASQDTRIALLEQMFDCVVLRAHGVFIKDLTAQASK